MQYKLQLNKNGQPRAVVRTDDNGQLWAIPFDTNNVDYIAYLKWVEEGGVPLPAEETQ